MSRAGILAVVLAFTSVVLLAVGVSAQTRPAAPPPEVLSRPAIKVPLPSAQAAQPPQGAASEGADPNTGLAAVDAAPNVGAASSAQPVVVGPILSASKPTVLEIPRLKVNQPLIELGVNPDHTAQVPPLSQVKTPGWLQVSPTPGELGPAVILGHVDSYREKGVFYRLGELRPGDPVHVI